MVVRRTYRAGKFAWKFAAVVNNFSMFEGRRVGAGRQ